MKHFRILLCCSMIVPSLTSAKIFDSIKDYMPSWLSSQKEVTTVHKKYAIGSESNINLTNIRGSVAIETNWNQDHVLLKAEITAPKKEQLEHVKIMDNTAGSSSVLSIKTYCEEGGNKAQVNYSLITPAKIGVHVTNQEGPISVKQVKGKIYATTTTGSITITDAANTIVAHATKQGDITIERSEGNIKASTKRGRVTISDSKKSVLARAEKGSLDMKASEVPPHSKIRLESMSGRITVCLPHDTNAHVHAASDRGIVTCQHELTLKPLTTTLDQQAWKQFKRSINGTIGSGVSEINLRSVRSNIYITKEDATA